MQELNRILCCPCAEKSDLIQANSELQCTKKGCKHNLKGNYFKIVKRVPCLITNDGSTLPVSDDLGSFVERNHVLTATKHVLRNIFNLSKNVTKSNAQQLNEIYAGKSATVLIVGSGETADGSSYLSDKIFTKIRTDVYFSEALDVICDAHELPFRSQSIDVVWTQAVLEHVLKPNEVVSEIERVIKDGGHVYSEVPFLQAVHEGAFDYQRYTKLGHRYLFKHFELVSLGTKGGPLLSLYWAMKYFFRAIFGFRLIYIPLAVFSIAPFWLLSFFCKKNSSRFEDAANGTFFLGTKKPKQLTIELLTTLY